jgi:hypothetical protein
MTCVARLARQVNRSIQQPVSAAPVADHSPASTVAPSARCSIRPPAYASIFALNHFRISVEEHAMVNRWLFAMVVAIRLPPPIRIPTCVDLAVRSAHPVFPASAGVASAPSAIPCVRADAQICRKRTIAAVAAWCARRESSARRASVAAHPAYSHNVRSTPTVAAARAITIPSPMSPTACETTRDRPVFARRWSGLPDAR